MTDIHPLAWLDPGAVVERDVTIGPFCVIESGVTIGAGCRLASHVVVKSGTTLGRDNQVAEAAVLGGSPQHLQAGSEQGRLVIGDNNRIREYVTIHRGLRTDDVTRVGDDCLIMVNTHVGHVCQVGNRVIMANNVMLSGHVVLEDAAYLSGAVGVHQFCRVGRNAMVGGQARVVQDVPPYVTIDGVSNLAVGINRIGLRRAGFSAADIAEIKSAYRLLYREEPLPWARKLDLLQERFAGGPAAELHRFLSECRRGFVRERRLSGSPSSAAEPRIAPETLTDAGFRKAG